MDLEDFKDRVCTCWASLDQQLINKAIDQWRPRLKTVVKVHGGHIEQHNEPNKANIFYAFQVFFLH